MEKGEGYKRKIYKKKKEKEKEKEKRKKKYAHNVPMGGNNFFLLEPMGCRITGFRNSVLIREAGGDLIPEGRMSRGGRKEYLTHKNELGGRKT